MKCSFAFARLPCSARIQEVVEIKRILLHLIKVGRAPPELDESSLNGIVPAFCHRDPRLPARPLSQYPSQTFDSP